MILCVFFIVKNKNQENPKWLAQKIQSSSWLKKTFFYYYSWTTSWVLNCKRWAFLGSHVGFKVWSRNKNAIDNIVGSYNPSLGHCLGIINQHMYMWKKKKPQHIYNSTWPFCKPSSDLLVCRRVKVKTLLDRVIPRRKIKCIFIILIKQLIKIRRRW